MKKIVVLLLILMTVAVAEDVSLQKAATLAVTEYPDLSVQPQSIPSQLAILEDETSYWIIEFDDTWVPVTREGEILKEEEATIIDAYKIHYALQNVIEQRDKGDYITSQDQSLRILLGDVETKETYLKSYKPQLPSELQDDCQNLIDDAIALKVAIQTAVNAMVDVTTKENDILFRAASYSDFNDWKTDFTTTLNGLDSVVTTGNAYNDERITFNLEANNFLNTSEDTAKKQLVQAFTGGISITNIPGSLPGLQGTTDKFRSNMLEIQLADSKIETAANEHYIKYREFFSGQTITKQQEEAATTVNGLKNTVPFIVAELKNCVDDLNPKEASQFEEMNETYHKAFDSYNEGVEYQNTDEELAKDAYLNAIAWAEDSQDLASELESTTCPRTTVTPIPGGFDPIGFLTSGLGILLIVLVLALGGLYWWNNNKKGNEGDYYEDEYTTY